MELPLLFVTDGLGKVGDFAALDLGGIDGGCGLDGDGCLELSCPLGRRAVNPLCNSCDGYAKSYDDGHLGKRRGRCLAFWHFADAAWAELGLLFVEEVVNLATDADAKCRLKEEQGQACRAHDQVDRADDIVEHHQVKHGGCQNESNAPCESLLRSAAPLRLLLAHHPLPKDHDRGESWIDEYADSELDQEADHKHAGGLKVAREPCVHEADQRQEKQNASSGADRPLV